MSNYKPIDDRVLVGPQITADEIHAASKRGVSLIINNRPDGEEADQPSNTALEAVAKSLDIEWEFLPVTPGQLDITTIEKSLDIIESHKGKVLAFCRTGTRSSIVWAMASAKRSNKTINEIVEMAGAAGYDLEPYRNLMESLRANG